MRLCHFLARAMSALVAVACFNLCFPYSLLAQGVVGTPLGSNSRPASSAADPPLALDDPALALNDVRKATIDPSPTLNEPRKAVDDSRKAANGPSSTLDEWQKALDDRRSALRGPAHAETDWLEGVDYNDGLSNEVTTWGYDVAGNRTSDSSASGSWTYDNLNRMSASPHGSYTNDLLGNRTSWTTSGDDPTYEWDVLNRLTKFQSAVTWPRTSYIEYQYRADGMRVKKFNNWVDPDETTRYRYDGQMGVEDVWTDGTDTVLTRYGIGARGIDVITKKVNSGSETLAYPLYDTHGNMVATLARSGGSSYSLSNEQSYDVWGSVRSGSSSEELGYVANLGHRADPESFLTYMRARYYEPHTGRFVSEDPDFQGTNWYAYCGNEPVSRVDASGRDWVFATLILCGFVLTAMSALSLRRAGKDERFALQGLSTAVKHDRNWSQLMNRVGGLAILACASFTAASLYASGAMLDGRTLTLIGVGLMAFQALILLMNKNAQLGAKGAAAMAVIGNFAYGLLLIAELIAQSVQEES